MKKQFWKIVFLVLLMIVLLSACGSEAEPELIETVETTETIVETTEPELEPDPEWLSEKAIDEAYACLFPLEGEKDVELAQEILLPLVEAGNAEAMYYWGYIYDWEIVDNDGTEEKEALYWNKLAATQGFPKAYLAIALNDYVDSEEYASEMIELAKQSGLFEMPTDELGPDGCEYIGFYFYNKKDYRTAFDWFSKAIELGSSVAMTEIGIMYYDGLGVSKDINIALDWLLKAANKGNVYAMNWCGYIFFENNYESEFLNQKYAALLSEYQKAAENGDPVAMHNIGQLYENGLAGLRRSAKTALDWYLKAANLGDAYSMYAVGRHYRYADNHDSALEWYLKAAELGVAEAMDDLCLMYSKGWGVKRSSEEAQEWWQKAQEIRQNTERGISTQYIDYMSEVSELRDVAIELFTKAADAGYATAMNNIGYYGYEVGYIYLNDGKAREWYNKAIDEGYPTAMANLGFSYYRSKNYDAAMEWLIKAHVNGIDYVEDDINYMLRNKQGVNAYFENYGELISATP